MNIQIRYCRICLDKNFIGQSIFEYYNNKSLPDIVMTISGIVINKFDNFSKLICFTCAKLLTKAFEIREKCLQSDFTLHEWQFGSSSLPPGKIIENSFPYKKCERHHAGGSGVVEDYTEKATDELWRKIVEETSAMSEELSTNLNNDTVDESVATNGFDEFLANLISDTDDNDIFSPTPTVLNQTDGMATTSTTPISNNLTANESEGEAGDEGEREGELNPNQISNKTTTNKTNPNNDKCIECKHCLKKLTNRTAYERHKRYHLQQLEQQINIHKYNNKTPSCPICHKHFRYKSNIKRHLLVHRNQKHFIYSKYNHVELCTKTNQHNTNIHKILNDYQSHHKIKITQNRNCDDNTINIIDDIKKKNEMTTSNAFNNYDKDDLVVDEQPDEYILECKLCKNHKTISLTLYLQHMREKHQIDDTKPFKCRVCDMTFASKQGMFRHIDNIHENNRRNLRNREKKFLCNTCGKCFYTNFHLEIHTRIHTGVKPYKCKICNKRFSQMSGLRIHQFTHTGEKPFACEICGKTFSQYGHVKEHNLIHSNEKKHICTICGHSFRVKGNLTAHMLVHSAKKPFSCGHCGKEYIQRTKLRAHVIKYHQSEYSDEDDGDDDSQNERETDKIIEQQAIQLKAYYDLERKADQERSTPSCS